MPTPLESKENKDNKQDWEKLIDANLKHILGDGERLAWLKGIISRIVSEAESRGYERAMRETTPEFRYNDAYERGRKAAMEEVKEITKKWFDANAIEVVIGKDATRHFLSFIESSLTK